MFKVLVLTVTLTKKSRASVLNVLNSSNEKIVLLIENENVTNSVLNSSSPRLKEEAVQKNDDEGKNLSSK